jgi:hypothetical protein
MEYLSSRAPYIALVFILTTFLTVFLFYKAAHYSKRFIITMGLFLMVQTILAYFKFYTNTYAIPLRFIYLVLPPLILIIVLFFGNKGRQYIDHLDQGTLTLLHVVRVPVEIVFYWLFQHKVVPKLMTFEGRNFDIISGLTAPIIFYLCCVKNILGKTVLLIWNFICLGLLLNAVIIAVLSAPFSFQQFAFDQPNVAILYLPYIFLPCCIVPIVLFSHLAVIRQLVLKTESADVSYYY